VDKSGEIKDIKSIFTDIPSEFQTWFKKNYTWIVWSLLIIAIILITWLWLKRRKKKLPIENKKQLSPAELALREIDQLIQQKFWIEYGEKEYYVKLSSILKTYLGANFQLSLSEKTSYEIQLLLSQVRLTKEILNDIQWVLQQADMVKFAKSEPSEIDMMKIGMSSKSIVEITSN
jgi:sensor c-di-GMP phosphodiesterase-like protein